MKAKFTKLAALVASFFLYLWQLPQNLLGLLLVEVVRPEQTHDFKGVLVHYASRMRGGISLGRHLIVAEHFKDYNGRTEAHEWGHSLQSRILGPLYLLVIGLPSLVWAAWWNEGRGVSYYSFYTEKWADKLGEVER